MSLKKELEERYQQFYCELGFDHEDTKKAKKLYDTYCLAEQEVIGKACNEVEDLLYRCKRSGIHSIPQLVAKFKKTMEE